MPGSRGLSTSQEMEADTGRPQRLYSSRHSVSTLLLLAACGLAVCARFDGGCSWVLGRWGFVNLQGSGKLKETGWGSPAAQL